VSKPVRIYDATYAEIEELARADRRSVANMVQLLLEQALALRPVLTEREPLQAQGEVRTPLNVSSRSASTGPASSPVDEAGAS
jgi:hypothetical protein